MSSGETVVNRQVRGPLGRSGSTGFGAWPIGDGTNTYGAVDEREALAALRLYIETGGTFLDTARAYGERSERLVGQAVRESGRRDGVIVATKSVAGETRETIPDLGRDLEASLRMMKLDTVDLFQLHQPPEDLDVMEEVLEELERFKREGKIRAIGASIKGPDVTDKTEDLCLRYIRSGRIDALQVVYSVLRQRLAPVIREAEERGILVIARTVLESGFLAGLDSLGLGKPGSMRSFEPPDQRSRYSSERLQSVIAGAREFETVCGTFAAGVPFARIAKNFALSCQGVGTVILGMRNRAHVMENIQSLEPGSGFARRDSACPSPEGVRKNMTTGTGRDNPDAEWKTLHDELTGRFSGRSAEFNYH